MSPVDWRLALPMVTFALLLDTPTATRMPRMSIGWELAKVLACAHTVRLLALMEVAAAVPASILILALEVATETPTAADKFDAILAKLSTAWASVLNWAMMV